MKRKRRRTALAVAAWVPIFVFLIAYSLPAQQPAPTETIKQEVPNNPSIHTPPVQPIPYSHKTHLALGLTCATCHTNPDPGRLMTFPATSTCMQCHVAVAKDKPAIQKLA
ncbi:MAG: cytochrome c3 family protein, partial [Terriglobia bacterium]